MLIRRLSLADVIPDWPTLQKVDFFALDEVWPFTSFVLYAHTHFPHAKLGIHFLPSMLLYFCFTAFLFVLFFFSQTASNISMLYVVCFVFVCFMCLSILCHCQAYIPYLMFLGVFFSWVFSVFDRSRRFLF